jgi:hypothetical protein
MNARITLHREEVGNIPRVQIGEFGECLTGEQAAFLASLAFESVPHSQGRVASLMVMAPRWGLTALCVALRNIGARIQVDSEAGAFAALVRLGSVALIAEVGSREMLKEALVLAWEASPVVWGLPKFNTPQPADLKWLKKTETLPPAVARQWDSLLISFYHGAWVAFHANGRDLSALANEVTKVAHEHAVVVTETNEPF